MKGSFNHDAGGKSWSGIWIPALLVLIWSGAQLVHDPTFFWCDDFQAYYSPIFEEIARAWHDGEWPLLSRNSWCAGNLAGEFQNATFSPVFNALLVAIFSLPLTVPLKAAALSIVYLTWLAMGVFMLGRLRGLTVPLGTTAALATSLSGWVITWAATDWFAFLAGFSWVPWVWWALQTAITADSTWKRWLRPGLCVALLITQGNAFATVEMAIVTTWLALQAIVTHRNWRALGPLAAAAVLGTGLSTPAWWLLIETLRSSPRGEWGHVVHTMWSVPWQAWPGLVLPSFVTPWRDFGINPEPHASIELACGLVPVAALAAAFLFRALEVLRKLRWDLALLVVCVLLASLPSIGQFRWSFRWLPLFHLVLALTATAALQQGLALRAAACGLGLTAAAWAGATLFAENRSPVLAGSLLVLSAAWWLIERFARRESAAWLPAAVVVISLGLTFWFLPTHQAVPKFSFTDKIRDPAPLDPSRLYLSLYSFKEIADARARSPGFGNLLRPADSMEYADLRFLNGYGAFGGRDVKALFESHGEMDPAKAKSLAGPDGERLLLFLGVDGIVFSDDYLPFTHELGPEWKKAAEAPEGEVYHREPRRFVPAKVLTFLFDRPGVPLSKPDLQIVAERRNSVTVRITPVPPAAGSPEEELGIVDPQQQKAVAPIAFVRPFLTGYEALFNGRPIPVREYRQILPIVELPAGSSGVLELRYRPPGLIYGSMVAGLTSLAMLFVAIGGRKRPAD